MKRIPSGKLFTALILFSSCAVILDLNPNLSVAAPAVSPPVSSSAALTPSRKPERGCSWKPLSGATPAISLLVQECDYGSRKITFSGSGNMIVQRYSDAPADATPDAVVEVYAKEAAESPDAVLRRLFVNKLQPYEQQHCVVRPTAAQKGLAKPFRDKKKRAWLIEPDAEYAAKIKRETPEGDMPEDACGEHGAPVDSRAYFEFHSDSPTAFAWVIIGQDTPLFDEQSLTF